MKIIYNKRQRKVHYEFKKCNLIHTENIMDAPLTLNCKSIEKETLKNNLIEVYSNGTTNTVQDVVE